MTNFQKIIDVMSPGDLASLWFQAGVKIKNADFINSKIKGLLEKYAVEKKDSISLKEKEEKK